jgi:uncharacterized protein (DUF488 family)
MGAILKNDPYREIMIAGYQGETIQAFIDKLVDAQVELLIDIRTIPSSRKPGFSKAPLERALACKGIGYHHLPQLGMPRNLLQQRHTLKDNTLILDAYDQLLPERERYIDQLLKAVWESRSCLMCFEADESQCLSGLHGAASAS